MLSASFLTPFSLNPSPKPFSEVTISFSLIKTYLSVSVNALFFLNLFIVLKWSGNLLPFFVPMPSFKSLYGWRGTRDLVFGLHLLFRLLIWIRFTRNGFICIPSFCQWPTAVYALDGFKRNIYVIISIYWGRFPIALELYSYFIALLLSRLWRLVVSLFGTAVCLPCWLDFSFLMVEICNF